MSVKETVTQSILNSLLEKFDFNQLRDIENSLYLQLKDYDLIQISDERQLTTDISPDIRAYQMFFVAKKIEGLSEKSLIYYRLIINKFMQTITKPFSVITTDDVRYYFATRQNVSLVTITNERRILLSFFGWLAGEEYISKNPVLRIKNIKQPKVIKKPFTQIEIEELRDACNNIRNRAIIEVLLSTGMRCNELCTASISDVDFSSGEITVTGKGNKQRICYLNASAKKRLKDYLESRKDNYPSLFVPHKIGKHTRLLNGAILNIVHSIGKTANIQNVHPHRFRRTAATIALQRGMPVEQVRVLLGHEKIDTTVKYAITADETVKQSHARYM